MTARVTRDSLVAALAEAVATHNDATAALAQDDFSGHYAEAPAWAIGPFAKDADLTFTPTAQWVDPLEIGWSAESIFNPSVIEHDAELVVFYRASPRKESTASRIGMARRSGSEWVDSPHNPIVYPTLDNEILGCEDPKIYRSDGRYFLFYNGIFPLDAADRAPFPSPG